MNTTHSRAKAGGQLGANGKWYSGGTFIATTDRAKSQGSKPRTGCKVLIAAFGCLSVMAGCRSFPCFREIDLRGEGYASADALDYRRALVTQFNEGKRWKAVASYDFL